jgi:hypothetical protein
MTQNNMTQIEMDNLRESSRNVAYDLYLENVEIDADDSMSDEEIEDMRKICNIIPNSDDDYDSNNSDSNNSDSDSDSTFGEDDGPTTYATTDAAIIQEPCTKCNIHATTCQPINNETFGECPICYEQLNMINITVTRCGHTMHSSCIFTALETTDNCPMCRTQLCREIEDDDDESEDDELNENVEQQEDDDEDEEEEEEEEETGPTVEQLTTKLQNMGYKPADFLMFIFSGLKSDNKERYSQEFIEKLDDDIEDIIDGTIPLSMRDTRSYADVARAKIPTQV